MSEVFSRILIDKALEDSGWNLLKQIYFELSTAMGHRGYSARIIVEVDQKVADSQQRNKWGQFLLDYREFCSTVEAEIALESLELIPALAA